MGILESVRLETKPDFLECMKRIEAWYAGEVIDRPPVRFHHHNAQFDHAVNGGKTWASLKDRWFDVEFQVESFLAAVKNRSFRGETFPVFDPNPGPDVLAAFHGMELVFGETTSWSHPCINSVEDLDRIRFTPANPYWEKIEELTDYALERASDQFLVGYTDLHPGMDFAASWRGNENLCMDFYDDPGLVGRLMAASQREFQRIFDHYHEKLRAAGHPSVCWMNIPDAGKLHIPSCDFGALIGPDLFREFVIPMQREEMAPMDRNIYHLDGPGVANHLDAVLGMEDVHAIQWVQGVAEHQPIMPWIPLIKKIRAAGKAVIVDLSPAELEGFMDEMSPEGLFLWVGADGDEQERDILRGLEKWTG